VKGFWPLAQARAYSYSLVDSLTSDRRGSVMKIFLLGLALNDTPGARMESTTIRRPIFV